MSTNFTAAEAVAKAKERIRRRKQRRDNLQYLLFMLAFTVASGFIVVSILHGDVQRIFFN